MDFYARFRINKILLEDTRKAIIKLGYKDLSEWFREKCREAIKESKKEESANA